MDGASILAFMASWFTPSSLFLLLNLMIGTIVLSSKFGKEKRHQNQMEELGDGNSPTLARAPSLLARVKSIDFSLYKFDPPSSETQFHFQLPNYSDYATHHRDPDEPTRITRTPSLLERLKSINLSSIYKTEQPEPETEDPNPHEDPNSEDVHVRRMKSESVKMVRKIQQPEKMKKSASEREMPVRNSEADVEEEEDEILERRRPATTRAEKKKETTSSSEDEGVDAKADDFINRFKQQLKLQRLDSLRRFGDMLKGK
ncbi:hypothetical protein UlMin_022070 [Ulmus minor]